MIDKLILIKEYKLFINRYYNIVINLDNRSKDIKILDYYFYLLLKHHGLINKHYKDISSNLMTILKLMYGWMK